MYSRFCRFRKVLVYVGTLRTTSPNVQHMMSGNIDGQLQELATLTYGVKTSKLSVCVVDEATLNRVNGMRKRGMPRLQASSILASLVFNFGLCCRAYRWRILYYSSPGLQAQRREREATGEQRADNKGPRSEILGLGNLSTQ